MKIVGIRLVGLHIHVVKPQSLKINKSAKNLQKRWIENHSYCIQYSRSTRISLSLCLLAVCYDGPLDLFGELHVFPENVSFASLQVLLKENR